MNILFIHQNFPGQFKHLAPELVKKGHQVIALSMKKDQPEHWQGVRVITYAATRSSTANIHPWLIDFETKTIRAESCFRTALTLRQEGFVPDVIIAHPGWGESLFLKEVWPSAKVGIYCEFFYKQNGADVGFDQEFPNNHETEQDDHTCRLRFKNLNNLLHFEFSDAGISPTQWQASTYPKSFRSKITVIHDGIDTDMLKPDSQANLILNTQGGQSIALTKSQELVTYVGRNLEPYRGFHIFMRTLPDLLQRRPNSRIVIVGGDGVSYGLKPPCGRSWKERMIQEVRGKISDADWSRVHFVGRLPYTHFITLLQLSTVHVYLTYPFVLSWSLLESMSVGCCVVASRTQPLLEVIQDNQTGRLVDFFAVSELCNTINMLLDNPDLRQRLGQQARALVQQNYDLKTHCLPKQLEWVDQLALMAQSQNT